MEGEVSNHGRADGAASVENNGYMGGKCREAAAAVRRGKGC